MFKHNNYFDGGNKLTNKIFALSYTGKQLMEIKNDKVFTNRKRLIIKFI